VSPFWIAYTQQRSGWIDFRLETAATSDDQFKARWSHAHKGKPPPPSIQFKSRVCHPICAGRVHLAISGLLPWSLPLLIQRVDVLTDVGGEPADGASTDLEWLRETPILHHALDRARAQAL